MLITPIYPYNYQQYACSAEHNISIFLRIKIYGALSITLTLMLVVAKFANTKCCKKPKKND